MLLHWIARIVLLLFVVVFSTVIIVVFNMLGDVDDVRSSVGLCCRFGADVQWAFECAVDDIRWFR